MEREPVVGDMEEKAFDVFLGKATRTGILKLGMEPYFMFLGVRLIPELNWFCFETEVP